MGQKRGYFGLTAWSEIVTIVCFLLVLVVPGVMTLVSRQQVKPEINKQVPIESVIDYYTRFKDYFQKSFGFRAALVGMHAIVKTEWLGVSPYPSVLLGKDGWLFYADPTDGNELLCSRRSQFNKGQLALWAAALETRRMFLEKKGIHYAFLVVPCKHTIYPEYLPEVMYPVRPQSRLDQLIDYVAKHTQVQILDVRPALIGAKPLGRLYYMTDTHWNTLGAFIAYKQVLSRVEAWYPDVKPHQLSDYSLKDGRFSGDLASMAGLQSELTEGEKVLTPKFKSFTSFISDAGEIVPRPAMRVDILRSENPNAPIPKLVMFRDSFSSALLPYISEHFRSAVFLWRGFDTSIVEKEKPDVVIEEMVERYLMNDLPKMP